MFFFSLFLLLVYRKLFLCSVTLLQLSFLHAFLHIFGFLLYNMLFANSDRLTSFPICIPLMFFTCLTDAGSS